MRRRSTLLTRSARSRDTFCTRLEELAWGEVRKRLSSMEVSLDEEEQSTAEKWLAKLDATTAEDALAANDHDKAKEKASEAREALEEAVESGEKNGVVTSGVSLRRRTSCSSSTARVPWARAQESLLRGLPRLASRPRRSRLAA